MRKKELYVISAILVLVGVLLVVMVIRMKGEESLTGENPESKTADAVVCTNEAQYPYLNLGLNELSHNIKVNILFDKDEVDAIGLYYDTVYESEEKAEEAYQALASGMNFVLDGNGVDAKFISNVRFTKNDRNVTMSLFAKKDGLNATNEKYLMIQNDDGIEMIVDRDKLVENYLKLGFECE